MAGEGSLAAGARPQHMARTCALLFAAAALVTVVALVLPHEPEVDEAGQAAVAGLAALGAVVMAAGRDRLPLAAYHGAVVLGTLTVSLALLFNGERNGGPAGGDEMFYLWVALCAAYYLGRVATAIHVLVVTAAYAAALVAIDPGPIGVSRWLSLSALVGGAAIVVRLLRERGDRLMAALEQAARTDPLTGLGNRRAFEEAFGRELARARRGGPGFALLLADVDGFKEVNDRHGHSAGDAALKRVADALRAEVRGSDLAARQGGDEFALVLAGTGADGAREVAERVSAALRDGAGLALSCGVAEYGPDGRTLDELARVADADLYARKRRAQAARASSAGAPSPSTRAISP